MVAYCQGYLLNEKWESTASNHCQAPVSSNGWTKNKKWETTAGHRCRTVLYRTVGIMSAQAFWCTQPLVGIFSGCKVQSDRIFYNGNGKIDDWCKVRVQAPEAFFANNFATELDTVKPEIYTYIKFRLHTLIAISFDYAKWTLIEVGPSFDQI